MKHIVSSLILVILLLTYTEAKYAVGTQSITLIEPNQQTYPLTVYYPAQVSGERATPISTGSPRPTIIFIHGLLVDRTSFSKIASGFASAGYVFFIPDLPGGSLPIKNDCLELVNNLVTAISSHSFMGEVAYLNTICDPKKLVIMGHSWGGGFAVELGRTDPRFKLVIALAPAILTETNVLNNSTTPVVLITGSLDAIVPNSTVRSLFDSLTPPRIILTLKDGTHNGFIDNPSNLEDNLIGGRKMDSETQKDLTIKYAISYIKKYLGS